MFKMASTVSHSNPAYIVRSAKIADTVSNSCVTITVSRAEMVDTVRKTDMASAVGQHSIILKWVAMLRILE
jgi:hypothetical protein